MTIRPPCPNHKRSGEDKSAQEKPALEAHDGSAKPRETAHHDGKDRANMIK
jgi:hypothetical protein